MTIYRPLLRDNYDIEYKSIKYNLRNFMGKLLTFSISVGLQGWARAHVGGLIISGSGTFVIISKKRECGRYFLPTLLLMEKHTRSPGLNNYRIYNLLETMGCPLSFLDI